MPAYLVPSKSHILHEDSVVLDKQSTVTSAAAVVDKRHAQESSRPDNSPGGGSRSVSHDSTNLPECLIADDTTMQPAVTQGL